ncbi:hypothetical protein ACA910_000792 [Epithemia clementina (nom. ined.)]
MLQNKHVWRSSLSSSPAHTIAAGLFHSNTDAIKQNGCRRHFSSSSGQEQRQNEQKQKSIQVRSNRRTNLIFGANTDVGKTIVSAGLTRASLAHNHAVHYIKPLQSGGSDDRFIQRHAFPTRDQQSNDPAVDHKLTSKVLFSWKTPASPHFACRVEGQPCSDQEFMKALQQELIQISNSGNETDDGMAETRYVTTYIETAGGVLSPAAASPLNQSPRHARGKIAASDESEKSGSSADVDDDNNKLSWGWQPQADLYQPLLGQCPVVLVGDGRLGGISATLSALESLLLRGYDVAAVVFVETSENGPNAGALAEYAAGRKFKLRGGSGQPLLSLTQHSIVSLPPIPKDPNEPLHDWYASDRVSNSFAKLDQYLQRTWEGQVSDLHSLRGAGRKVIWWPFTQHANIQTDDKVTHIDSANGDYYNILTSTSASATQTPDTSDTDTTKALQQPVLERSSMFDACASWWTQGIGHGDPSMALSTAAAAGRYGHVIFPDVVHEPAVALSQKLLGPTGPGYQWADRVFFTDNGSTGVEVAVKMAMKTYQKRVGMSAEDADQLHLDCVAQVGSYHGDTLGVMNMSEPSIFNQGQHPWYEPRGLFLDPPTLGFKDGQLSISFPQGTEVPVEAITEFDSIDQVMDVPNRMIKRKLIASYRQYIDLQWLYYEHKERDTKLSCVVIEPIFMGAGGMKFVDPLWQRALMDIAKEKNVPIVFDEVAAGLHRVGVTSCREILESNPDIACYAKLLTGGLLPLSVTLASNEVFETFLGDEKGQALLHGHSYTANPVGCVAALHALDVYDSVLGKKPRTVTTRPRKLFDENQVRELSLLPIVDRSFALGTVLTVTIKTGEESGPSGYGASSRTVPLVRALRDCGIYARPLGNVIYIMASPLTSTEECVRLTDKLHQVLVTI